ncbi:kunitz/Bovine pancreatic trypsin inhibitor domain-containing protein [Phthorimaea operculella]|nr:kunitz/Bovine pancreatic trypsin inhibitor domain-containing protein [Phthorimaea operculella]
MVPSITGQSGINSVTIAGHFEPVTIAGHFEPVTIAGHYEPVTIAGHYEPVTIAGHFEPVTIAGHLEPVTIAGHFEPVTISSSIVKKDIRQVNWETWCQLQPIGYDCGDRGTIHKFYYDIKMRDCKTAEIGAKCENSLNRFDTITQCHDTCIDNGEHMIRDKLAPSIFCRLQPDFGGCNEYHPRFYFDVTDRQCKGFSYSGCGGNMNRFSSFQLCSAVCMPAVDHRVEEDEDERDKTA